jgi:hypothetical protein
MHHDLAQLFHFALRLMDNLLNALGVQADDFE